MRRFLFSTLISFGFLAAPALQSPPLANAQDDWSVRRDPFDKNLIARYKRILVKKPGDAGALGKLMGMYRRYRSVDLLIREYQSAQEKHPGFSNLMVLGYLHQHEGKGDAALGFFQEAVAKKPGDSTVHAVLGKILRDAGRLDEASKHYQEALKLASNKSDKMTSLRALADLAMAAGDIEGASKFFKIYIELDPKNLQTRLEFGDALAKHERHDQAIEIFRAAEQKLRSDPAQRVDVITRIGMSLEGKGEDMAAVAEYERGIKLVGPGYYAVKELTARIVEIYRRRGELAELGKKLEKSWPSPARRGHFEWDTLARIYEETGLTDKAIESYRKATAKAPYELDTQRRLIVLLENSGLEKDALRQYEVVIRIAPGEPRFQLELAKRYWKNGETSKALAMAKKVESRFSGDPGVISTLADLYTSWNKPDLALASYQQLARIEPEDPQHLENLGEQYFQKGERSKAQQTWKKIIRVKSAENYARLASVYAEHDFLQDSLSMYGQALRLEDKNATLYKGRANLYERMRRWNEAMADWEMVLSLSPDVKGHDVARHEARRRVVNLLVRSGNGSKSQLARRIKDWKLAFHNTPADLGAGYYLVQAYEKNGQVAEQQSTLERLRELRPKDQSVMEELVKVYRDRQLHDKAVNLLLELAKLNPGRERDYYNQIAEIKTDLQQDSEAIEYVHRALEKSPNDPVAYQRLAERYQAMQKQSEAITAYEKVIEISPGSFPVYFTLARLYINQGERHKATQLYRRILSKASDQETLHKAGQEAVELEWLNGSLAGLERTVAPLVAANGHKPIYRRILVRIYDRYVPDLVAQRNGEDASASKAADAELKRLGAHGLRPLLEALADDKDVQQQEIAVAVLGFLGNQSAAAPLVRLAKTETKTPNESAMSSLIPSIDMNMRVQALVAAGRLGDPRAIPDLIELSTHSEFTIQGAAIFALGKTNDRKAIAPLLAATDDDRRPSVQVLACLSLAGQGDKKVGDRAIAIVDDESQHDLTRAACAYLLGYRKEARAQAVLSEALLHGNDETQRLSAWALGQLGQKSALPALISAYYSKQDPVRSSAAAALQALLSDKSGPANNGPAAAPLEQFPMASQRFDERRAVRELGSTRNGSRMDASLLIGLEKELTDGIRAALQRHRDLVLRALSELDDRNEGLALGMLTGNMDSLRPTDKSALEKTLRVLASNLQPDLASLTQHRDPEIRRRSLSILAKIGGESSASLIHAGLSDSSLLVRRSAMQSAARLATLFPDQAPNMLDAIIKRLQAEEWQERVAAAQALGAWPGHQHLGALLPVLRSDSKGFVRSAAARALAKKAVASAPVVGALGDAANHRLEPLEPVRIEAVRALHALGGQKASELLVQVSANDPSKRVRQAALGSKKQQSGKQ